MDAELKRIQALELKAAYDIESITEEELLFAFDMLKHDSLKIATAAAIFLSGLTKPVLIGLTTQFPTLQFELKKTLIQLLSCTEFVEIHQFLFKLLRENKEPELNFYILFSLSRTEYFIFPLIITELENAFHDTKENMKNILQGMGFSRVKPFLGMMPYIPEESFFRDVFGADAIESIKPNLK